MTLSVERRARRGGWDDEETLIEFDPPRCSTVRGVGGPVEAVARASIEPLADGARSRVTIALDFEAHGIGKVLLPLLRHQARKQLPRNVQKLKEQLERSSSGIAQAETGQAGS